MVEPAPAGFAGQTASVTWRLSPGSGTQSLRVGSSLLGEPFELAADIRPFTDVDAVVLEGVDAGDAVAALVDGSVSLGEVDDFRFVGSGPTLGLGDWRGDGTSGELMVFVPDGSFLHAARSGRESKRRWSWRSGSSRRRASG